MQDAPQEKINGGRARSMIKIISATLELLRAKPYSKLNVIEICDAAGVARKTFYKSFESKCAVIEAALDSLFFELTKKFDFSAVDSYSVIAYGFEYLNRERALSAVFLDKDLFDIIVKKITEYVEYAYGDMLYSAASFEPTLAEYYHTFIAVGIISIVKNWAVGGYKQSPKVMAKLAQRLLSGVIS